MLKTEGVENPLRVACWLPKSPHRARDSPTLSDNGHSERPNNGTRPLKGKQQAVKVGMYCCGGCLPVGKDVGCRRKQIRRCQRLIA